MDVKGSKLYALFFLKINKALEKEFERSQSHMVCSS